jgi:hypothetical protein
MNKSPDKIHFLWGQDVSICKSKEARFSMNLRHMRRQLAVASAGLVVLSGAVVFNSRPAEARIISKPGTEWVKKCFKTKCYLYLYQVVHDFYESDEPTSEEPPAGGKGTLTRTGGESKLVRTRVVRVIKRVPIAE